MTEDQIPNPHPDASSAIERPRNRAGWVYICFLFSAMILLQGLSYFGRKPHEPLREEEAKLRTSVLAKSLAAKTGVAAPTDPFIVLNGDLEKLRPKNDDAERLWVISAYEQGKPIPAADLERLKASSVADGPQLAHLYAEPKLTASQAKAIIKTIEGENFSTRLARVHAQEKGGLPSDRNNFSTTSSLAATGVFALLSLIGLCLWAAFAVALSQKAITFKGHSSAPMSDHGSDIFAMRVSQLLAAFILLPLLVSILLPKSLNLDKNFVAELVILAATFLVFRLPIDGEKISLKRVGFHSEHWGRDVMLGVGACIMNLPLVLALGLLGQYVFRGLPEAEHPIQVQLQGHPSALTILSLFFAASVVAPLFEETLFRGTFFPAMSHVTKSPVWGALITSILFATIHPTGIPAWPGLAAVGAMSCLLAYKTGSLIPSIVMHACHNALLLWVALSIGG